MWKVAKATLTLCRTKSIRKTMVTMVTTTQISKCGLGQYHSECLLGIVLIKPNDLFRHMVSLFFGN